MLNKQNLDGRALKVFIHNVLSIKVSLLCRVLLLVLFLVTTLLFSGCTAPTVYPTENDLQALQNIYEDSSWIFQQSSINVRVNEGGAVELLITGEATEKEGGSNSSIWIPVALLKELPQYYGTTEDSSSQARLMAYKVKEGLWSIVALIPRMDEQRFISGIDKQRQVDLNILMVSPAFAQSLPLNLPIGQGINSVQTSVELPPKAKFTSLWARGNGESVKLVQLPPSISNGNVKALAGLQPELASVWELSDIEYRLPGGTFFSQQSLLKMAQWVSLLCAVSIAVWLGWELWINQNLISQLRFYRESDQSRKDLNYVVERILQLIPLLRFSQGSLERSELLELEQVSHELTELIEQLDRAQSPELRDRRFDYETLFLYRLNRLGDRIYHLALQQRHSQRTKSREGWDYWNELYYLGKLLSHYPERAESRENLDKQRRRFRFYIIVAVLGVIALVLFVSSAALSQDVNREENNSSGTSLLLGNFSLSIDSSNYDSNEITAILSFLPLSTRKEPNDLGQIDIEFGGSEATLVKQSNEPNHTEVDVATVDPSSSWKKYRIKDIPIRKIVGDLALLTSASKRNVQLDQYDNIEDIYNQAIKNEPKPVFIKVEFKISDVLVRKEQVPDKGFNWFPIDKAVLEMPINIEGATSIISKIEVETPIDLYTQVEQSGIENISHEFKRDQRQVNKYFLNPESDKFILINSGNKLTIMGNYERNLPGRVFLTLGISVIGGILGVILGIIWVGFSESLVSLVFTIGSIFLGLIAIFVTNKDFQSFLTLRGQISFFDIFLGLGLLSLGLTALSLENFKRKGKNSSLKRRDELAPWLSFGVFSLVIPILLLIFIHP